MTNRQSFLVGLIPAALLGAFWIGRASNAPAPAPAATGASSVDASAPAAAPVADPGAVSADAGAGAPPMAASAPPLTSAQMAGGGGGDVDPNAPLSPTPELDTKIAEAEKGGDKKAISSAYTERGTTRMYDEKAGRKTKYRAALDDFRKAVTADPTNKDAKAAKDTIESIYKSLGRPIPGASS